MHCSRGSGFLQAERSLSLEVSLYKCGIYLDDWVVTVGEVKQKQLEHDPNRACDIYATMAPIFWQSFLTHLTESPKYRTIVLNYCYAYGRKQKMSSKVTLIKSGNEALMIDYSWNERLSLLVNERAALDTVMSYLSTLGGAFSSLGDQFLKCAEKAGEISRKQFQLALRLGEEPLVARCRLYLALSLLQQERFELSRDLIKQQYILAYKMQDNKLKNMCRGIWAKLQYAKKLNKNVQSIVSC